MCKVLKYIKVFSDLMCLQSNHRLNGVEINACTIYVNVGPGIGDRIDLMKYMMNNVKSYLKRV